MTTRDTILQTENLSVSYRSSQTVGHQKTDLTKTP